MKNWIRTPFIAVALVMALFTINPAFAQEIEGSGEVVEVVEGSGEVVEVEGSGEAVEVIEGSGEAVDVADPEPAEEVMEDEEYVAPVDPEVPEDLEDAEATIMEIISAANAKAWPVVVGLILMLLIFVTRRWIEPVVGDKGLPAVATATGIVAAIATALAAGDPVGASVLQGFLAGATATGLWELMFKHFLSSKSK